MKPKITVWTDLEAFRRYMQGQPESEFEVDQSEPAATPQEVEGRQRVAEIIEEVYRSHQAQDSRQGRGAE
jgi:hypothetical protein